MTSSDSDKLFVNLKKFDEEQMNKIINNEAMMQDLLNIFQSFDKELSLDDIKEAIQYTNIYSSDEFKMNFAGTASNFQNNIYLNSKMFQTDAGEHLEEILRNELPHIIFKSTVLTKTINLANLIEENNKNEEYKLKATGPLNEFISFSSSLFSKNGNSLLHKTLLLNTAKLMKSGKTNAPEYEKSLRFYDQSLRKYLGNEATDNLYNDILNSDIKTFKDFIEKIDLNRFDQEIWTTKIPGDFLNQAKLDLESLSKQYADIEKELAGK
ncbi:MAG: hypothetical protein MK033_12180 [Candidatus Caenarcaniphilales bacterium]|nr:hypothetical protein [Candidatus Caenarcaniphilales bacterium]